jgi:hypothetical protein
VKSGEFNAIYRELEFLVPTDQPVAPQNTISLYLHFFYALILEFCEM